MTKAMVRGGVTIECRGAFLALADEACAINTTEFWNASRVPGERRLELRRLGMLNEIFEWNPILDGVFRLEFSVGPLEAHPAGVDITSVRFVLSVPTGRLVVRSTLRTTSVLRVVPGTYDGILTWDFNQESLHSELETADDYPADDAPDGQFTLCSR